MSDETKREKDRERDSHDRRINLAQPKEHILRPNRLSTDVHTRKFSNERVANRLRKVFPRLELDAKARSVQNAVAEKIRVFSLFSIVSYPMTS